MAETLTCSFQKNMMREHRLKVLWLCLLWKTCLNLEMKLQPAQEGALSVLVLYPEYSGCFCITIKELLKMTEINTLPQRSQQNNNHCCLPSLWSIRCSLRKPLGSVIVWKTDCLCFGIEMFHTHLSWSLCNINGMGTCSQVFFILSKTFTPSVCWNSEFWKQLVYLEVFDTLK